MLVVMWTAALVRERRVDDLRPGRRLRLRLTGVDLSCDASAIVEGCLFIFFIVGALFNFYLVSPSCFRHAVLCCLSKTMRAR